MCFFFLRPSVVVEGLLITLTFASAEEGGNSILLGEPVKMTLGYKLFDLPAWVMDLKGWKCFSLKSCLHRLGNVF